MAWHKPEVREQALNLIRHGYTASQAALELGLNSNTVGAWKAKYHPELLYRGPGRRLPLSKWLDLERLCFHTVPVPSFRSIAQTVGVHRGLARQMWQSIRDYQRRGLRHPKLGGFTRAA